MKTTEIQTGHDYMCFKPVRRGPSDPRHEVVTAVAVVASAGSDPDTAMDAVPGPALDDFGMVKVRVKRTGREYDVNSKYIRPVA